MGNNQHQLFRILNRPDLPLHNNLSEQDIRNEVRVKTRTSSPAYNAHLINHRPLADKHLDNITTETLYDSLFLELRR